MPNTPCEPWATAADVPDCDDDELDAGLLEDNLLIASQVLFNLTDGIYPGECDDVVRPVRAPQRYSGASVIRLPGYPVTAVSEVKIDGLVVNSGNYKVLDRRWLAFIPSDGVSRRSWPSSQNLSLPVTEERTWQVSYSFGRLPPAAGVRACALYARELTLACAGSDACQLPERVTTVTRAGITYAMAEQLAEDGEVGLRDVDNWVRSDRARRRRRGYGVAVAGVTPGVARVG